jgi:hypothetical protein
MRRSGLPWLAALVVMAGSAAAQTVVHNDERLAHDRPEAWAMNDVAASTFMTAFGATPLLAPGRWQGALELTAIPRLSAEEQRVGLGGFKEEDLDRSPVFGRGRLQVGLPAGWVAEVAYTPPIEIAGTHPRELFDVALAHRVIARDGFTLSARLVGQHGFVGGDITCPARLAGIADPARNPSGCVAASDDRLRVDYYGGDATLGRDLGAWHWHATLGVLRTELAVQVNAHVFDQIDRSRLVARDVLPYVALGVSNDVDPHWNLGAEVLYVPLTVRRDVNGPRADDSFVTLRVAARFRP